MNNNKFVNIDETGGGTCWNSNYVLKREEAFAAKCFFAVFSPKCVADRFLN